MKHIPTMFSQPFTVDTIFIKQNCTKVGHYRRLEEASYR